MAVIEALQKSPAWPGLLVIVTVDEKFSIAQAVAVAVTQLRAAREGGLDSVVTVLGHVMEGDSTAHVVYRMRMSLGEGMQMDQVQVAPLKRADGEWRVLLTGSLAGMMGGMGAAPTPD